MRLPIRVVMAPAVLVQLAAMMATPASGNTGTVWLCHPGRAPDPCRSSLGTTIYSPGGGSHVITPRNARRPKIDCFYVYPTVSPQPGPNATLDIEPAETSIARYQAARFSRHCRVFAPMYRQLTLGTIGSGAPPSARALAYSDVRSAWKEYLQRYNHGRGVVLIGHSQGTFMLRVLIHHEIDPRPAVRKRVVSALLLGGNVTVRDGSTVGGDFQHMPGCTRSDQIGCVVAYSLFDETPPADAIFGRVIPRPFGGLPAGPGYEVLCTNPAALGGGWGRFRTLVPSKPMPGALGAGVRFMNGGLSLTAPTPWLAPPARYRAKCMRSNGANVLMVQGLGAAPHLTPSPTPAWGLHLADGNLPMGNLVRLVGYQQRAYLQRHRRHQ